jgi:hypothetical protein
VREKKRFPSMKIVSSIFCDWLNEPYAGEKEEVGMAA